MKKTLLVTLDFHPNLGGVAAYWKNLGQYLPSESFVVLVPPLPHGSRELLAGYRIYRKSFFSRFLFPSWLRLFFSLREVIKKEKIEYIIVGQILPLGTVVWLFSFFFHIPYSVSLHGMDIDHVRLPHKKMLCTYILKGARAIIANSRYTASMLTSYDIEPSKCTIVYPCPAITPLVMKDLPKKRGPLILTVGRLVQRKGHEDVIGALKILTQEFQNLEYAIIGDGPYRGALESYARSLRVPVRFLGALSDEDCAAWYGACDLFIMTPKNNKGDVEGFGIVYLEANGFGKPVIGSRTGGITDAVSDGVTGLLVEPGNNEQIARAIRVLLTDPVYAHALGQHGRERVEKEFQWEQQAHTLIRALL